MDETDNWAAALNEVLAAWSGRVASISARADAALVAVERAVADGTATAAMLRPIIAGALDIERGVAWLRDEAADRMHKLAGAAFADSSEAQREAREAVERFRAARTESETAAAVRELCATMESGDPAEPAAEPDRPRGGPGEADAKGEGDVG